MSVTIGSKPAVSQPSGGDANSGTGLEELLDGPQAAAIDPDNPNPGLVPVVNPPVENPVVNPGDIPQPESPPAAPAAPTVDTAEGDGENLTFDADENAEMKWRIYGLIHDTRNLLEDLVGVEGVDPGTIESVSSQVMAGFASLKIIADTRFSPDDDNGDE